MTPFAGAYRALLTGRRSIGSLLTRRSRAVGVLLTLIAALALALLGGLGDSVQGQTSNQRAVRIDVTFTGNFVQDALAAGETLPTDTTFASVAFATHQSTVSYFQPGQPASAGLKAFAESGSTTLLVDEFTAQTHPNNVYPKATQGTFPQDATAAQTFGSHRASRGQDHLTFVASFSQSPDWFVGARNIDLRPGDVWIEELEVDLFAWDAGTDSGADWDSANAATTPPGNVTSLEDAGKFSDTPIGKLTITMLVPPSHDLGPVQLRHVLQADANPLDGGLNVYWDAYYPPFKVVRSSLHTVDFDRYLVAWKSGDQEFQTALDGDRVKVVMDRNSNHTIIEGLTNGTEYTVRVTHANAVGPAVRHSRTSSATPAARERVLVSTFSQGLSHSWGLPLHLITNDFGRKYVYNRFTTGPNATNLGSVTFARIQPPLISSSPVSPTLELHLLEDLPGGEIGTNFVQPGQPGPLIGKFVSPPEYPDGPAKFVAPGDGFALSASTDYWLKLVLVQGEVVIPMTMIGGPGPHNNLDPDSLAGWDIGNACQLSLFDIWNRRNITNCSYYSNFMVLLSGPVDSTLPRASISGGSAVEGESIEFKVELSSAPSAQATVQYDTVDGSARLSATTSDNDYTAVSGGTVTFDPGETSKTISIATGDDSIDEHDERFIVRLSSPSSNIVLSELDAAAGVIINDDYTAASNSTLAGLTLTDGDGNAIALNETFDPLRFVYTADAAGEVDAVNATLSLPSGVTPRQLSWFDAFGKVEEGDQTQAGSAEFTRIVAGLNPFRVLVTSRDGSRESLYTVMMNKAASSDATIATLVLEDNSFNAFVLSPAFSPSVTDYTATVANTPPFYVDAGLNHGGADAQVSVNGTVVIPYSRSHPSDNFAMRPGQNTLVIEVTAEDGTVETYTLQVTVQFSRDVKFGQASFSVSEGSTVSVPVILDQPAPLALTIPLTATRQGGATAADYAVPLSVDFAVGDTQQTVTFAADGRRRKRPRGVRQPRLRRLAGRGVCDRAGERRRDHPGRCPRHDDRQLRASRLHRRRGRHDHRHADAGLRRRRQRRHSHQRDQPGRRHRRRLLHPPVHRLHRRRRHPRLPDVHGPRRLRSRSGRVGQADPGRPADRLRRRLDQRDHRQYHRYHISPSPTSASAASYTTPIHHGRRGRRRLRPCTRRTQVHRWLPHHPRSAGERQARRPPGRPRVRHPPR